MRFRLLPLLLASALGACGGDDRGTVGTWRLDAEKVVDFAVAALSGSVPGLEAGDGPSRQQVSEGLKSVSFEFHFAADRTFRAVQTVQGTSRESMRGRWEERSDAVVLTPTEFGGREAPRQNVVELKKVDGRLEAKNGPFPLVLVRK
jgi:hypothetical protein